MTAEEEAAKLGLSTKGGCSHVRCSVCGQWTSFCGAHVIEWTCRCTRRVEEEELRRKVRAGEVGTHAAR